MIKYKSERENQKSGEFLRFFPTASLHIVNMYSKCREYKKVQLKGTYRRICERQRQRKREA